ncbi:hypothetical protein [Clostridium perfringens]|uniref:hypothetical protein n=1 Tax=Clostridium perfringens TaxID=1502 RepID=UPI0023421C28|nr:hypothetical protein [Clostridium perfringens]MDC4243472.1 hypothetical protein [Clostridium perfringens]
MKKLIISLLSLFILGNLFVGCGQEKETPTAKQVKIIENETKDIDKNAEAYLQPYDNTSNRYRLDITVNIDKENYTDEELSNKYNSICEEIFKKIEDNAINIKDLEEINFNAIVSGKSIEDSKINCYKYPNNDGSIYFALGALTSSDDFREKTQAEKDEKSKKVSEATENFKKIGEENKIVEIPSEPGYFEAPKLLDNLKEGKSGLAREKASFELKVDNDKKIVKVRLIYKNQVLIVGIVNNIRNNIANALGNQCDEIDLTIIQEKPMDLYECKYKNGLWDKEVK